MRAMRTVVAVSAAMLSVGCGGLDEPGTAGGTSETFQGLTSEAATTDLAVGAFVGVRLGGGETPFVATSVHVMPTARGEAGLHGTVAAFDAAAASFTVLGVPVRTDAATTFEGVGAVGELADGRQVGVRGAMGEDGVFLATELRAMEPGLGGEIEAVTEGADGVTVTVLGQQILVPTGTKIGRGPGGRGEGMGPGECGGRGGRGGGHGRHGRGGGDPLQNLTGIDL